MKISLFKPKAFAILAISLFALSCSPEDDIVDLIEDTFDETEQTTE